MAEISKVRFNGTDYDIKSITDTSLSEAETPADAKAVGDNLANVNDFEKTTFKNPTTFSRLTTYSYWTFGGEIVEGTGENFTNDKACRTTYVKFTEPILLLLDNVTFILLVSIPLVGKCLYSL